MKVNQKGIDLIKRYEGFRRQAYRDAVGVWTIGYGHTSRAGAPKVTAKLKITRAEGEEILKRDVAKFAAEIAPLINVPLSDDQFSALVSFAYNTGPAAFASSSVLRMVNAGRFDAVPNRLSLWVKAGGKTLKGLVRRRAAEAALFTASTATPGRASAQRPEAARGKPVGRSTTVMAALASTICGLFASLGARPGVLVSGLLVVVILAASGWIVRERWLKSRHEGV
ncbi:MAG TPA: lysozyme [Rhizobiales bacterium]|nr:lysozyme [Hyphomicrobiales bacterium]